MISDHLSVKAASYLQRLCVHIPSRRTGSPGNQEATDFFATTVASFGFATETPAFECIDWIENGADLSVAGFAFDVRVSPYSLGCPEARAPLVVISTIEELNSCSVETEGFESRLGVPNSWFLQNMSTL